MISDTEIARQIAELIVAQQEQRGAIQTAKKKLLSIRSQIHYRQRKLKERRMKEGFCGGGSGI